jgi:hypothetical protein
VVTDPDWHTPSWLFEQEIAAALDHVGHSEHSVSLEFRAVQQLLRFFDGQLGPNCARIVFWFDN